MLVLVVPRRAASGGSRRASISDDTFAVETRLAGGMQRVKSGFAQLLLFASVLQLAQNFSRVVYVRDSQGLAFRWGARVVPPAVPDELRVTVADRADHELVAALQYVGDALYGVRLHDGA